MQLRQVRSEIGFHTTDMNLEAVHIGDVNLIVRSAEWMEKRFMCDADGNWAKPAAVDGRVAKRPRTRSMGSPMAAESDGFGVLNGGAGKARR